MATEIASAYVSIYPQMNTGFGKSIHNALGNAGSSAATAFGSKFNTGAATFASAAGNLIASGIGKAMGAVSQSMDAAISRVDTLNNFPKVMANLGISAEQSSAAISKISEGIKGLPTRLDTAASSVQRLVSVNGDVEKSADYFLALNNAILAGGASTEIQASAIEQLSQAYSKGKMDMMEWRTLQMAMPAQINQIAKSMGISADALGEGLRTGTISMETFMQQISKLNSEGVDGFASFAEQAKTATGGIRTAMSNLDAAMVRNLANIINAFNSTGVINTIIGNATSRIDAIGSALVPVATFVGQKLSEIIAKFNTFKDSVITTVQGLIAPLQGMFSGGILNVIKSAMDSIGLSVTGGLTAAFSVVAGLAGTLLPMLSPILGIFSSIGGNVLALGARIIGLINPVTLVIGALAAMYASSEEFRNTINNLVTTIVSSLVPVFTTLATSIQPIVNAILPTLVNLLNTLAPPIAQIAVLVGNLIAALAPLIAQVISAIMPVIVNIVTAISNVINALMPIISVIMQLVTAILSVLMPVLQVIITVIVNILTVVTTVIGNILSVVINVIATIIAAVQPIITFIVGLIATIIAVIGGLAQTIATVVNGILNTVMSVVNAIINAVSGFIGAIVGGIVGMVSSVSNFFVTLWNNITSAVSSMWSSVTSAFSSGVSAVISFVSSIPGTIMGLFASAGSWLLDAGRNIVVGLWNGISGSVSWLIGKITGWVGDIISKVQSLFGEHSPSKVFARIGLFLGKGLAIGISSTTGIVNKASSNIANAAMSAFEKVSASNIMSSIKDVAASIELQTEQGYSISSNNAANYKTSNISKDNSTVEAIKELAYALPKIIKESTPDTIEEMGAFTTELVRRAIV